MRLVSRIGLVVGGVLLFATPVQSQYAQTHKGIYATFGLGYGLATINCDQCVDSGRTGDLTGFFGVGGALAQSFLLGFEAAGWSKVTDGNDNRSLGAANAVATWYPSTREGFFIKAGLGLGWVYGDQELSDGRIESLSQTGISYVAGLGYDMRIQRNTSVTAIVNFYGGNVGDVLSVNNLSFNVLQFMAAVTFH